MKYFEDYKQTRSGNLRNITGKVKEFSKEES